MAKKTATANNVTELRPKAEKERLKKPVNKLSDVPAIERYLDRIGATAKSPRTATITRSGEDGYERDDIAVIKLAPDGSWQVPDSIAPTDAEREEISNQIGDYVWPLLVKVEKPTLPKALEAARKASPMNVFEFRDMSGKVVMYQQRIDDKDGVGKKYVPWTNWNDGKWRNCEPDEALPLWGLDQLKSHSVVFIHEGAKAARHARKIASLVPSYVKARGRIKQTPAFDDLTSAEAHTLSFHPWREELQHAAHVGWIGGAPNPHRTDWTPLKNFHRVFIVADNDTLGVDAVWKIARELRHWNVEVYDIRFDAKFPLSFDLADDFISPSNEGKLWNWREPPTGDAAEDIARRRYIGPTLRELLGPATWAVEEVPQKATSEPKGRGRPKGPTFRLRKVFRDQWKVATEMKPVHFINLWDPSRLYIEDNFNKKNRPFAGPVGNLSALMTMEHTAAVDLISYEPGKTRSELIVNGKRTINTWTPALIKPVDDPRLYQPQPWFDFLEHLIPLEEERKFIMRWCATLIARPDIRMTFGLLLVSEKHGIGKTTLAEVLSVLVGSQNTSWPTESDIVDSPFNSWIAQKRLVVCNEIYSGHSWKAYNKLKTVISDKDINVNEKHIKGYSIRNYAHVILCSNSLAALKVEPDDRRIYQPKVNEKKKPPAWWVEFRQWISGDGHGIILEWARRYVGYIGSTGRVNKGEVAPIGPEMHPPMTEAKRRAIRENTDEDQLLAERLATQAIEWAKATNSRISLVDRQVQEWVALKLRLRREDDDPRARAAWRRSFRNVRTGLRNAGLTLVQEFQDLGFDNEVYGTFDPDEMTTDERKVWDWSADIQHPDLVEQWAGKQRKM